MMKADKVEDYPAGDDTEASPHVDEEQAIAAETAPEPASSHRRQRRRKWAIIGGGVISVIVILAIVLGCYYGLKSKDEPEPSFEIHGNVIDIHTCSIFPGTVVVQGDTIRDIIPDEGQYQEGEIVEVEEPYILPGFVDSHVHIESSLLVPSEFARLAAPHGTVATVSDPHEIANVLGLEGIKFMLDNAEKVPVNFFFGAPSCVPATPFETAGAEITADDIRELFKDDRIKFLSEMMNWPGVLFDDPVVLEKIQVANDAGLPVDGHAPTLRGEDAVAYIQHGISTDHETVGIDEAYDKLEAGMNILIREGLASQDFDTLHPIIGTHPGQSMFCTDDAHPDLLAISEIDYHVRKALTLEYDYCDVLRIASKNPVEHYDLPIGLLRVGDPADFIIVDKSPELPVLETWIKGKLVAKNGEALFDSVDVTPVNNFNTNPIEVADIARDYDGLVRVMIALNGTIITGATEALTSEPDVLKIVNVNRYFDAPPAVAYVKGFGLLEGALASSVAHDSHNILAVGVTDQDIVNAVNAVIETKGGLAASVNGRTFILPLPVAGIMSDAPAEGVVKKYRQLDSFAKELGASGLPAPFMTLSFMALLVIPELKLSDMGLFDGSTFGFVDVAV